MHKVMARLEKAKQEHNEIIRFSMDRVRKYKGLFDYDLLVDTPVIDWFKEHSISWCWLATDADFRLCIDTAEHAMLFRLRWLDKD